MITIYNIWMAYITICVMWLLFVVIKNHYDKNANTNNCSKDGQDGSNNKLPMSTPEDSRKVKRNL